MDLVEFLDRLASVLFPQRCAFCGEAVAYDDFWCGKCGDNGNPPFTRLGRIDCDFAHDFTDVIAALEYADRTRNAIWSIKDSVDRRALRFLAEEMYSAMSRYWNDVRFDLAVPVPATASKMEEKGFNQAELLAFHVCRQSGVAVRADALTRHESTQVQRNLTAAERRVNAARSYDIGNPDGLAGKNILLVDDVFTTGSTASACSDKLLEAGADCVYVLTATSSPPDDAKNSR